MKLSMIFFTLIQSFNLIAMEEDNSWTKLDNEYGFYNIESENNPILDLIHTANSYKNDIKEGKVNNIRELCFDNKMKETGINKFHSSFVDFSKEISNQIKSVVDISENNSDLICHKIISSIIETNNNGKADLGPIKDVTMDIFKTYVATILVNDINKKNKLSNLLFDPKKVAQLLRARRKATKKGKLMEIVKNRAGECAKDQESSQRASNCMREYFFMEYRSPSIGSVSCNDKRSRIVEDADDSYEFDPKNPHNVNPALLFEGRQSLKPIPVDSTKNKSGLGPIIEKFKNARDDNDDYFDNDNEEDYLRYDTNANAKALSRQGQQHLLLNPQDSHLDTMIKKHHNRYSDKGKEEEDDNSFND